MPTHAHGQGYTDINFVIPELVESIEYRKGTYYADTGNFSAAGAVNLRYRVGARCAVRVGRKRRGRLPARPARRVARARRRRAADRRSSTRRTNGPWLLEERLPQDQRAAALFARRRAGGRFAVTAQGYDGEWRSTDQIPLRAVQSRRARSLRLRRPDRRRRVASLQPRCGLVRRSSAQGACTRNAYAIDYELDLFSNFTYAIDTENGDQFEQFDDRRVYGGAADAGRGRSS